MLNSEEIARLDHGPAPGEAPRGVIADFTVRADDAGAFVARLREPIRIVLCEPDFASVSPAQWRARLPAWFVGQCVPEEERRPPSQGGADDEDDELWSVSDWVEWFGPADRPWRWWNAERIDATTARVLVVAGGLPFAWAALEWSMRCAGASDIEPGF